MAAFLFLNHAKTTRLPLVVPAVSTPRQPGSRCSGPTISSIPRPEAVGLEPGGFPGAAALAFPSCDFTVAAAGDAALAVWAEQGRADSAPVVTASSASVRRKESFDVFTSI